ncbi:hypothetical protein HDU98_003221 [Podochytrium sp. JEL0797]|nr:hypothetical protein HDU98_003221 [Podochytrium sp. JEL0797]
MDPGTHASRREKHLRVFRTVSQPSFLLASRLVAKNRVATDKQLSTATTRKFDYLLIGPTLTGGGRLGSSTRSSSLMDLKRLSRIATQISLAGSESCAESIHSVKSCTAVGLPIQNKLTATPLSLDLDTFFKELEELVAPVVVDEEQMDESFEETFNDTRVVFEEVGGRREGKALAGGSTIRVNKPPI